MGNAHFYWYPDAAGSLEKTDLGDGVSDIQEPNSANVEDAYAGDGTGFRNHLSTVRRIRWVFERFGPHGSSATERELKSLESHLFKGRPVGISADHAKTWAGVTSSLPTRGDTLLYCGIGNGFTAWSASGNLAVGDEVVVENAHPEAQYEVRLVGSGGGTPRTQVPVQSPVIYTYTSTPVVRWKDFYPVCWLPKDQVGKPFVAGDHRRNFTLDITLEYQLVSTLALFEDEQLPVMLGAPQGAPALRSIGSGGFGGSSLQELLQNTFLRWRP